MLLSAATADAGPKKTRSRTETKSYDAPSTAIALDFLYAANCNPPGLEQTEGCVQFDLRPSDRLISFKIEDATGNPIYATVWDGRTDLNIATFCGETEKPIPNPGTDLLYLEFPINASTDECFPSTVTHGTVTATFSLRKQR